MPSRSSADPDARTSSLVARILDAVAGREAPVLAVIDGRSGAGKSTLARHLVAAWPRAQLVALDEVYPGWDGLAAGAEYARTRIVEPYTAGMPADYRRWDWAADRYADAATVRPDRPLVLEGSGALVPAIADVADVSVWLDAPAPTRRERALARDGDTYRPHWERWARQEDQHIREHAPRSRAMIVCDAT